MLSGSDFYLSLAINEAWKYQGLTYPNPAVGCVITDKNGCLLAISAHKEAGSPHAELNAVKIALTKLNPNLTFPQNPNDLHGFILKNHNNLLKDSYVYVTLEPCSHQGKTPSCAMLLKALHVKGVVIGLNDENKIASGGANMLKNAGVDVVDGGLKNECKELIEPFLTWQKGNFSFFKLALSQNGVVKGGVITCKSSRQLVHRLRDKCDLLMIGGNTVRVDKPTLDARLCNGKAPDILIYSKRDDFDKTIPLFSVPNRRVYMQRDFSKLNDYNFTMIEGGEGMLNALPDETDWFLLFRSPHFKNGENIKSNKSLRLLWQDKIGEDSYGWYKKI